MHELGVVMEVVRTVLEVAEQNQVTEIETVVLQIGQLSSCIPHYVQEVWPAAADGTLLQNTRLEIEVLPANGRCRACGKVFDAVEHKGRCPACQSSDFELLGGREFLIKEIVCA